MVRTAVAAYDAIAEDYDQLVAEDQWLRESLWRRYRKHFARCDSGAHRHVLDLGCGTGLDSCYLASLGLQVTAIDPSPAMVDRLRSKVEGRAEAARIDVRVGSLGDLAPGTEFDGAVSAFAALNTAGPLPAVADALGRRLKPGAMAVVHLLTPCGWWDRQRLRSSGRGDEAARRLVVGQRTVDIAGRSVDHRMVGAESAIRAFAPSFRLRRCCALGWLWPQKVGRSLPRPIQRLGGHLESLAGTLPALHHAGRFYVLELERRRATE